jgi:uncharacterized protein
VDQTRPEARINSYRVVLTEACNLACTYCFEKDFAQAKRRMSDDTLDAVVDRLASRHNGEHITVHWFGGEPLLRLDSIMRGVERFASFGADGPATISHGLTTHGGLVKAESAAWMGAHRFHAYVSVDGVRETHDAYRIKRGGQGSYDEAVRGYWLLRAAGVHTGILLTPHPGNVRHLSDSVRHFVEELGSTSLAINTPQPTASGWGLDGAELARQLQAITRYCSTKAVSLIAPHQRILRGLKTQVPQVFDCTGPDGSMGVSIAPDGNMSFCIVSWNDDSHRAPLSAPDAYERAEKWKLRSHLTEACRSCVAEMVCGGPCALEAQFGKLDESRCDFYRTTLAEALLR